VIDGVNYACVRDELDTRTYDEGVVFFLEMDLDAGIHSFHFTIDDGDGGTVTTEPLSVAVKAKSATGDETNLRTIMFSSLIIIAAVLVAILLLKKRVGRGDALVGTPGKE
jgi:hypothetical protein